MRIIKPVAVIASVFLLWIVIRPVAALRKEIQLTPKNTRNQQRVFYITARNGHSMIQFDVSVTSNKNKLSPLLTGRLYIISEDGTVADILVHGSREIEDAVVYWFRISPKFLSKSRFEFEERPAKAVYSATGKPHFSAQGEGTTYWFYLRDFAKTKGK